jgi:hypothetical protein
MPQLYQLLWGSYSKLAMAKHQLFDAVPLLISHVRFTYLIEL